MEMFKNSLFSAPFGGMGAEWMKLWGGENAWGGTNPWGGGSSWGSGNPWKTPLENSTGSWMTAQYLLGGAALTTAVCGVCYGTSLGILSSMAGCGRVLPFPQGEKRDEKASKNDLGGEMGALMDEAVQQGREVVSFAVSNWRDAVDRAFDVARFTEESLEGARGALEETDFLAKRILDVVTHGEEPSSVRKKPAQRGAPKKKRG